MNKQTNLSDPIVLCFMANLLIMNDFLCFSSNIRVLVDFFEIFLGLAIILTKLEPNDAKLKMLKTCLRIIKFTEESIEKVDFESIDQELFNKLVNNQLFRWIYSNLDFNTVALNQLKSCIIEIQTRLLNIQDIVFEKIQTKIEVAFQMNRFVFGALKKRAIFEEGRQFNYLMSSLQIKQILRNEDEARSIYQCVQLYETDRLPFKVPLQITFSSNESMLKINFKSIGNSQIKIQPLHSEEDAINISKRSFKSGVKSIILDNNETVQFKVIPDSQVFLFGSELREKNYYDLDFIGKLYNLETSISKIVCNKNQTMFILEDESIYCINSQSQTEKTGYSNLHHHSSQANS